MKDTLTGQLKKSNVVSQNSDKTSFQVLQPVLSAQERAFDRKHQAYLASSRLPGAAVHAGPCEAREAGPQAACAMLDTSTPKLGSVVVGRSRRRLHFGRVSRRMFSRVILGLQIPGRYYFITFTTTPTSPSLPRVWDCLRKWLHAYRPGMCWIYCFTDEGKGQGVIHMVIRLGKGEKRLDARTVRSYWENLTGARQIVIKPVSEAKKDDLASYLANQKKKRGLGCEFSYQSSVTKWRWSKGWLPKGFSKEFGRIWYQMSKMDGLTQGKRLQVVHDCLIKAHEAAS